DATLPVTRGEGRLTMRGRFRSALSLALCCGLLGSIALSVPAAAAPARSSSRASATPTRLATTRGRALADRDDNRISDDLDRRLGRLNRSTRTDVVATFADRASLRSARSTVRLVEQSFSLIDGFSANLTSGQIRALARRPGVIRVENDFAVRALDDAASRDFGVTAARTDFGVTGAGVE